MAHGRDECPHDPDRHARPGGGLYEWYTRGRELLDNGSPAAAAQILAHAAAEEPGSRSIREALARAQFDAGMYSNAMENFRANVEAKPDDDYARFGLGLSAARLGDFRTAVEHLALAAAMRPDVQHYDTALRGARATLRARRRAEPGDGE
ncbi:MAG: tetratricopeptide repeat protein [Carbonactinosporaceae bacterium]